MFSPYFARQMPAIYREMGRRYAPDGFFTNGWPSTGPLTVCYCERWSTGARALPFRQEGRSVRFEVPGVVDYEVVALT